MDKQCQIDMKTVYAPSPIEGLEILSCNDGHQFVKHLHDGCYVLWLNSEAGEHFSLKGENHVLQPGEISIIEPGVIHSNHPCVPGQRHLRSFYFSEEFHRNLKRTLLDSTDGLPLPTCIIKDRLLWKEFSWLHEDLLRSEDKLDLEVRIVTFFAKIFERCRCGEPKSSDSENMGRIDTIIEYFHENIDRQFSLDELADLVHCSSYHLIRFFRDQRGMSPHAFLIQLRLEKAKTLLDEGLSITDAAFLTGFSDQSHLTRKFKERYGVPPGLYRKQKGLR